MLLPDLARAELAQLQHTLTARVLPHERREEREAYPLVATSGAGADPTAPLIATHREIERLVAQLGRPVDALGADGPGAGDRLVLRRLLYGLHAILRLRVAQEEDAYLPLDDGAWRPRRPGRPSGGAHRPRRITRSPAR